MACYEAGSCGYNIYHQPTAMDIECMVVAPSLIPKSPTDRIKERSPGCSRIGEIAACWRTNTGMDP